MIWVHDKLGRGTVAADQADAVQKLRDGTWIDVVEPTDEEMRLLTRALAFTLPTRGEAQEIESSSRLYQEDNTIFMTATIMVRTESDTPDTTPVTFAFQPQRLVTLRFAEPMPFRTFPPKFDRSCGPTHSAQRVFVGLIDEIIDRIADILEATGSRLNRVSSRLFGKAAAEPDYTDIDYSHLLIQIGRIGELAANARESLVTMSRLHTYFIESARAASLPEGLDEHWRTIGQDITSLTDHATFLSSKVNFFLDATLGRINIEQNSIIKIFSVASVVFLPPTLIASVYGMNFGDGMPELKWRYGYLFAIGLMILSAVVPYWIFKKRKWL
jgi:magnesium transporter